MLERLSHLMNEWEQHLPPSEDVKRVLQFRANTSYDYVVLRFSIFDVLRHVVQWCLLPQLLTAYCIAAPNVLIIESSLRQCRFLVVYFSFCTQPLYHTRPTPHFSFFLEGGHKLFLYIQMHDKDGVALILKFALFFLVGAGW